MDARTLLITAAAVTLLVVVQAGLLWMRNRFRARLFSSSPAPTLCAPDRRPRRSVAVVPKSPPPSLQSRP